MLRIKPLVFVLYIMFMITPIHSNPFHNNAIEDKVPVVRSTGNGTPMTLIKIQMEFRDKMANLIIEIKEDSNNQSLFLLLFIGFLYGIVHAAGPGHRKTVLFSIFISNKSKWWEPGLAGVLSAFLHGLSGIALIVIFKEFSTRLLSSRVDIISKYMESISFLLLFFLALLLFVSKIISIIKKSDKESNSVKKESKSFYYTVLLTSLFPCPGAILILILSLSLGVLNIGILTVIFLSLGMGITISITAYLGRGGRVGLFKVFKSKEDILIRGANYLELFGYLFLIIFSGWMVMPLLTSI